MQKLQGINATLMTEAPKNRKYKIHQNHETSEKGKEPQHRHKHTNGKQAK